MRLGIKGKQIAGVTAIVGVAMMTLSALYVTRVAGVVLQESHARGQLLSNAIFHGPAKWSPAARSRTTRCGRTQGCARFSSPAYTAKA